MDYALKKLILPFSILVLSGCGDEPEIPVLKTTHSEIEKRFSENGTAAESFYKGKSVQITDTVNSVMPGGNVVLVDDAMQPYTVNVNQDSYSALAKLKAGDKLTVRCGYVDSGMISWCDVPATK